MKLQKDFFKRDAKLVAKELLGKIIVRDINGKKLKALIVEAEAYYDENDPASRACKNGNLRETMLGEAGTILVYGIHNCWLINFVTGRKRKAQAVLLRALEPLNFNAKTNGPGLLTKAMKIDKKFHCKNIFDYSELKIISNKDSDKEKFKIQKAYRIGVKRDLPEKLRFYIKDNK